MKHPDNRIFISFDHMFVKNKFTVFALSLKISKQGLPIYFSSFESKGKDGFGDTFKLDEIKSALLYIHNLFKFINPNF